MPKLIFAGLSLLTQIATASQQLLLLPLLIVGWGKEGTAAWFAAMSFATLASAADLGLRSLGQAELRAHETSGPHRGTTEGLELFLSGWSWIRIFVPAIVVILSLGSLQMHGASHRSLWSVLLILAMGLETLLIARVIFLDTVGRYVAGEATFSSYAVFRFILLVLAATLGSPPVVLAGIYAGCALGFLLIQEFSLGGRRHMSLLAPFRPTRAALRNLRYTLTDPVSSWAKLSLPVLVLYRIATPELVTLYVGLRALFALVRSTVSQASRVMAVEFFHAAESDPAKAHRLMTISYCAAAFLGAAVGAAVIADHGRLLSLWLGPVDPGQLAIVSLAFALAAPFDGYQLAQTVLIRMGLIRNVGGLLQLYIGAMLCLAGLAMVTGQAAGFLMVFSGIEVLLAVLMFRALSTARPLAPLAPPLVAGGIGALACTGWWLGVLSWPGLFTAETAAAGLSTIGLLLGSGAVVAAVLILLFRYARTVLPPERREA